MPRPYSVCVFCGSRMGHDPAHRAAAVATGASIAERGWRFVYGGGGVGLMGVSADAALEAGGRVIGVIPGFLKDREAGNDKVDDLIVTDGMHDRKQIMFNLADAFLILPGGVGTMDETVEILTWRQLGSHDKPIVMANLGGYWDPLLEAMRRAVDAGFMGQDTIDLLDVAETLDDAFAIIEASRQS